MNLWGHHFSQNANQKFQGFLPYQTIKDRSTFFGDCRQFYWLTMAPCLFGRAEILVIFGWHFGRNDDLINLFWIQLTFIKVFKTNFFSNFSILSCFLMGDYVEKHACIQCSTYLVVQPRSGTTYMLWSWHVCTLSKWNLLYLLHM